MRYVLAVLCVLAVAAAQAFYGGLLRPVFALPAFFLVGLAGVLGGAAIFWRNTPAPNLGCVGGVVALAGWLVWREVESPDAWLAGGYLRLTLGCAVMYLLFACVLTNPYHRLAFVAGLFVLAVGQAAVGIWQVAYAHEGFPLPWFSEQLRLWYSGRFGRVAHGFYLNRNHLAWFLNAAALLALALTCWGRWGVKTKVLCLYVAMMSLAGSVLAASRGGFLGLVAGVAVFCVLSAVVLGVGARRRRFVALLAMVAGLAATGITAWYIYENNYLVQERYGRLTEDGYRFEVFPVVSRQFQLEPVLGTGPGSFLYHARQFREAPMVNDDVFAHNDWAQLAGDFGFPALALLILAVWLHVANGGNGLMRVLRERMQAYSRPLSHAAALILGGLACLAAFAVHSLFDFNMQIPANALLASAVFGMLANTGGEGSRSRGGNLARRLPGVVIGMAMGGWLLVLVGQAARPEFQWLQAENAVLRGDWQTAAQAAEEGLVSPAPVPGLHAVRGEAFLQESLVAATPAERWRLVRRAEDQFTQAVEMAPWDWNARRQQSLTLLRTSQRRKAEEAVLETIALNPWHRQGYAQYAVILADSGRLPEAISMHLVLGIMPAAWEQRLESRRAVEELRKKILKGGEADRVPTPR